MGQPVGDPDLSDARTFLAPPRPFGQDLAAAHGDRARWTRFYAARFPDCTALNGDACAWLQGIGADSILQRPSGKQLLVEEKVRSLAFGDCLVEVWSAFYGEGDPRNRVGWSLHPDKHPDLLAYAVRPLSRCWLLPFDQYRALARTVVDDSSTEYRHSRTVAANGDRWVTVHTSIQWSDVYAALRVSETDVCFEW